MPWDPRDMTPLDAEQTRRVNSCMDLVSTLAVKVWRQAPQVMDLDELKSEAAMGLVRAAQRWASYCAERGFDPDAESYFRTFASRRITGAVLDFLRADDWARRSLRDKDKKLRSATRAETTSEAADRTGLSVRQVEDARRDLALRPVSLDADVVAPHLLESRVRVESSALEAQILTAVATAIERLPPPERVVLVLHYYVTDPTTGRNLELQEVADVLGITESRASHLHTAGVLAVHDVMLRSVQED